MSEIVLIRKFDKPISADYLHQATIALGWCRTLYGVNPSIHFLALDGQRCACIFDAPDAEAVRNVIRAGGRSEPEALWPCTVHPGPNDDGVSAPVQHDCALILTERLFARRSQSDERQTDGAFPADRNCVRFVRSYISHDRGRAICLYTAPDVELVREAHEAAGVEFERIWPARAILGTPAELMTQSS
jgi:Nickel responsive protein SCO4226-like